MKQIINAHLLTPSGWEKEGTVVIDGGKIIEAGKFRGLTENAEIIDAKGNYVVPGGIEIHAHGGGGRDFMEGTEDAFRTVMETHLKHGTTSFFPTLASSTVEMIEQAAETCTKLMEEEHSPFIGLHLEGPYLNPVMGGGQIPEYIKGANPEEYIPLVEKWTCIKRWDAAPELPGALEFASYLRDKGIVAGIAHTNAAYDEIRKGYEAGFTHATHFYNGMTGIHKRNEYRHEGTVESIYLIDGITVEIIADGKHLPPSILALVHKFKGVERTCLVTDALACTGVADAKAFDPRVIIEDGVCKLSDTKALAGSVATMDRLIRTVVNEAGIPLADAVRMASETPAKVMGVYDRKGSLEKGKDADLLFLDKNFDLTKVFSYGREIKLD
ncbi:MAG: N-acetylglucosamine-6-phosphate deacetylase [Paramuribaculum sp.]|nr:N-acetylglucosamine-6-phosphate deacetylase [Paramuribaculum sp.]